MIKQLKSVGSAKPGIAVTKDALQDAADILEKKYTATNANVPANLEYVKVTDPNTGVIKTLTKPVATTTAAGVKEWLEGELRAIGFAFSNDYSTGEFPGVDVVLGTLSLYGQAVFTHVKFASVSEAAFTVYATKIAQIVLRVELGVATNPPILVDGTTYTTTMAANPGTTAVGTIKTAIDTAIAAVIPSKVYKTTVVLNTAGNKYLIDFYTKQYIECKVNAVEALQIDTVGDFV